MKLAGGLLAPAALSKEEVGVQLVADRFLVNDRNVAIDLASGARVELVISSAGSASEQARWAARCGRFAQTYHRAIAPLLDYGALGAAQRFEAWRCSGPASIRPTEQARTIRSATEYLEASGLTTGNIGASAVREFRGAVILPDTQAGYEIALPENQRTAVATEVDALGLRLLIGNGLAAVTELFDDPATVRPRVVGLFGMPGSGMGVYLRQVASAARLRGYVALAAGVADPEFERMMAHRSVLVISRDDHAEAWRRLVHWSVHTAKPPVLIVAGAREIPLIHTIRLTRFSRERLIEAVQPNTISRGLRRRVESAAHRSNGLPGRFTQLLWGEWPVSDQRGSSIALRAAEHAPVYEVEPPASPSASRAAAAGWASADELATLRRRMAAAIETLDRGRHAAGDRQLRQVVGSLTRRDAWLDAGQGGLELGRSLLRRGRALEARTVLGEAHAAAMRGGEAGLLIDIAIAEGLAATDLLQLDAAETALHAALAGARGLGQAARTRSGALALTRCLFWRGRFDEALSVLGHRDAEEGSLSETVHLAAMRCRLAVGIGDAAEARLCVVRAERLAAETNHPSLIAIVAYVSAFAHLAVGDSAAADREAVTCVRTSRAAHHPILGVCARLVGAEIARRSGRHSAAAAIVSRIGRIATQLPPIVRARHALLAELLTASETAPVVRRHVNTTGLKGLALWVPSAADGGLTLRSVNDIVDILGCCHAAEDDATVLTTLCARLRARLEAASVTFFIAEREVAVPVASDGGRIDLALGRRLFAAGQPVVPHQVEERIEGGIAVRYAGKTVGALAARWLPGSPVDAAAAVVLLSTAAAAAGPALVALSSRRSASPGPTSPELLGSSAQMNDVRRAVDRSAAAPFAVLVEGESGSGKELIARALHRLSPRRNRPFCTLNCAALPDELVESELFGHARGAFTGAVVERPGVFEEAHSGTLFLDEIGELSLRAQAKVLRTIQEGELRRVGENVPRHIDVRLVTATNRDLRQEVAAGRFRLDLLYRIDVLRIVVPPLRDRRDDVPVLAEHFWRESTTRVGSRAALSTSTVAALARYDWPGNVRELQNVLASLAVRSPRRGVVAPTALPPQFDGARTEESWRLEDARRTFETRFIRAALARSGGHRSRAAEELGVTRQGLTKLMVRLGIAET